MKTAIKITGFIPNPEMAAAVVAWTFSLAGPDDEIEFLCYEKKISEQTQLSVKELLKESEKEIYNRIKSRYDRQISPYYAASRLWYDAIIDPVDTRKVISMGIEMANHAPITERYNVGAIQT